MIDYKKIRKQFYNMFYDVLLDGVEKNGSYSFRNIKKDVKDNAALNAKYDEMMNAWSFYRFSDRFRNNIEGAVRGSDLKVVKKGYNLYVEYGA